MPLELSRCRLIRRDVARYVPVRRDREKIASVESRAEKWAGLCSSYWGCNGCNIVDCMCAGDRGLYFCDHWLKFLDRDGWSRPPVEDDDVKVRMCPGPTKKKFDGGGSFSDLRVS